MSLEYTLKDLVENSLWTELVQTPLWTLSAFGSLKEGDKLDSHDVRIQLLVYLIVKHFEKIPRKYWTEEDEKYRTWLWKVSDFFPLVKQAVAFCKKYQHEPEYIKEKMEGIKKFE